MPLVLFSLALLLAGSAVSLFSAKKPVRARKAAVYSSLAAALCGLPAALKVLFTGAAETLALPWPVPLGSFSLALDPLAAFFLVPVLLLTALGALYGWGYLRHYEGSRPTAAAWAQYNLLAAAMALVTLAANAVLFMTAWELMAAASFLLVLFEGDKPQARRAAFIYLATGAAGALALLAFFALLGANSASLDFAALARPSGGAATAVFLLALAGFGLKAGFIPLHVWLPEAHPAAPSHVSAVMSGVMIKMGVYGLLRALSLLAPWPAWWGGLLLGLGILSGLVGILFALAQHGLKRLLAYSSVENIGVILIGAGLGMLGLSYGSPAVAALALAGALLHALNHALFKGLLFMGAGAVIQGAGIGETDALGGLARRMPRTALCFLTGSAAICALPPLNGFAGEFLIYLAAFKALTSLPAAAPWAVAAAVALAAIGALAGACFAKAGGTVFLGEPRTEKAAAASEPGGAMLAAMYALAGACVLAGLLPFLFLKPLAGALGAVASPRAAAEFTAAASLPLYYVSACAAGLWALIALAAVLRRFLLRGRAPAAGPTWDCGYARPTPRMQYGGSSFVQPLTDFFRPLLRTVGHYPRVWGYFPAKVTFSTETSPVVYDTLYAPAARRLRELAFRFTWLQHGRLQFYIMYIILTLIALLLWKL